MHGVSGILEHLNCWRLYVDYKWLQLGCPQSFDGLVVRTQQTHTSCIHNTPDAFSRGAIEMSLVLSVLNEFTRLDVLLHFLTGDEQIFTARDLSWSDVTSGVYKYFNK